MELLDAMDHYDRTNDMADELILSLADVQDKANAFLGQVRAANRRLWQVAESVKDVAEEAHGSYQWKVYSMAVAWLGASVSTRVRIEEIELDLGLVVQPKGWAIELKPAGSTTASEVAALARRVAPAANWQTAGSRNDLQQSTVDLRFDAPPQDVLACVEPWLARATESSLA